jgi:holliday junction DNA helicase RuvA
VIASLRGRLLEVLADGAVIEVGGVGYRVFLTPKAAALTLVPGVGRKGAARLILELKGKLGDGEPEPPAEMDGRPAYAEVREALGALGYGPAEIKAALAALPPDAGAHSTEELLRLALRGLGSQR